MQYFNHHLAPVECRLFGKIHIGGAATANERSQSAITDHCPLHQASADSAPYRFIVIQMMSTTAVNHLSALQIAAGMPGEHYKLDKNKMFSQGIREIR